VNCIRSAFGAYRLPFGLWRSGCGAQRWPASGASGQVTYLAPTTHRYAPMGSSAFSATQPRRAPNGKRRTLNGNSRMVSGYLLLEVLLALVVLSIIAGLVFRIIQTTSRVTANVQFLQTQQEHSDGLYELLRKDIESLSSNAVFQTKRTNEDFQLIFEEATFNFSWRPSESGFGTVVLEVRQQADGRFALSATEIPEPSVEDPDAPPPKPIVTPLISGLERCDWRFFDPASGQWTSNWTNTSTKPLLFECTFKLSGQPQPIRAVFRWRVAAATGS
jgi:type II secretory pathway pseudopilin PulG